MLTTKLHINISQGIIDVEGDPDLVRAIYDDLKERLLAGAHVRSPIPSNVDEISATDESGKSRPKGKRRPSPKKRTAGEESSNGVNADAPKLDKHLDTSGLTAFYNRFEPKNNAEKILIFLKYLTDELGIDSPNTDQFYTCFEKVDARVPKAFAQAFYDASGRKFGFIDYDSPTDIKITTVGNNFFKFDLKKKDSE